MFHLELAVTLRLRSPFFENDNKIIPTNPRLNYSLALTGFNRDKVYHKG